MGDLRNLVLELRNKSEFAVKVWVIFHSMFSMMILGRWFVHVCFCRMYLAVLTFMDSLFPVI